VTVTEEGPTSEITGLSVNPTGGGGGGEDLTSAGGEGGGDVALPPLKATPQMPYSPQEGTPVTGSTHSLSVAAQTTVRYLCSSGREQVRGSRSEAQSREHHHGSLPDIAMQAADTCSCGLEKYVTMWNMARQVGNMHFMSGLMFLLGAQPTAYLV
jgi:hypothetical protein